MKLGIGNIALVYGLTACVFFIIDLFWLGAAARGLYDRHIGGLLREQVNWGAAILFYLVYIAGIQVFVLVPALSDGWGLARVALYGGMLGFFAYATFDLTSLALIRNWSLTITVVDLVWGTVLTGTTATLVVWLGRVLIKVG